MVVLGDKENTDVKQRKTVIYVRYKLGNQKKLEERAEDLRAYLIRNGVSPDITMMDSSDFFVCSQRNRPQLYKLIDMIEQNQIDTIYTYSTNDISIIFFNVIEYLCRLHNTKIVAVKVNTMDDEEKQELRVGIGKLIAYLKKAYL